MESCQHANCATVYTLVTNGVCSTYTAQISLETVVLKTAIASDAALKPVLG